MNPDALLFKLLYWSVPVFWALTIHEFAHAYMAVWAGDPTPEVNGRLTLNPLAHLDLMGTLCMFMAGFGWAKPVPVNPYNFGHLRRDNILVSVAGVTTNVLMAVAGALVYRGLYLAGLAPPLWELWQRTAQPPAATTVLLLWIVISVRLNLALAVFNMLPIPPLDGSHVIESYVPPRYGAQWAAYERAGPLILFGLIILEEITFRIPEIPAVPVISWIMTTIIQPVAGLLFYGL